MLSILSDLPDENASVISARRKPPVGSGLQSSQRVVLGKRKALGEITNVTPSHPSAKGKAFGTVNIRSSIKSPLSSTPGPEHAILKKAKAVVVPTGAINHAEEQRSDPVPPILQNLAKTCPPSLHHTAVAYAEDGVETQGRVPLEDKLPGWEAAEKAAMHARAVTLLQRCDKEFELHMRSKLDDGEDDDDIINWSAEDTREEDEAQMKNVLRDELTEEIPEEGCGEPQQWQDIAKKILETVLLDVEDSDEDLFF